MEANYIEDTENTIKIFDVLKQVINMSEAKSSSDNEKILNEEQILSNIKNGWVKEENGEWYYYEDNKRLNTHHKFDRDGVWIEEVREIHNLNEDNEIISDELCDFIAYFEGCTLNAYYCPSNILTIGIGCTRKEVTILGTITKKRAYLELKKDILIYVKGVDILCCKYNVSLKKH